MKLLWSLLALAACGTDTMKMTESPDASPTSPVEIACGAIPTTPSITWQTTTQGSDTVDIIPDELFQMRQTWVTAINTWAACASQVGAGSD